MTSFDIKKYLPLIFVGIGVLILIIVFVFIKRSINKEGVTDEEVATEIAFNNRPVASLTPSGDGHWLKLRVDMITLAKASSLDYELLYGLPDGRTQGVPGSVDLNDQVMFERDLLLGSESSGKYRYDEGVSDGSLTIRIRDSKGKLLAKFSTKFNLQSGVQELDSVAGDFKYTLANKSKGIYFVTMETFGLPDRSITSVEKGPYGVFASEPLPAGTAEGWTMASANFFYK